MKSFKEYTEAMQRLRRLTGLRYAVAMDSGKATLQVVTYLPNGTSAVSPCTAPMSFGDVVKIVFRAVDAADVIAERGGDRRAICAAVVKQVSA